MIFHLTYYKIPAFYMNRVTVLFIVQIRTLLRVKGGPVESYTGTKV